MDGNINKALWLGIGVLFFLGVVSLGITLFNKGKSAAQVQAEQLGKLEKNLIESEFAQYDNMSVNGTDVVSAIRKFKDKSDAFSIQVETKKSTVIYLNSATFTANEVTIGTAKTEDEYKKALNEARESSNTNYINPIAKFNSELLRDKNKVISGIIFKQD